MPDNFNQPLDNIYSQPSINALTGDGNDPSYDTFTVTSPPSIALDNVGESTWPNDPSYDTFTVTSPPSIASDNVGESTWLNDPSHDTSAVASPPSIALEKGSVPWWSSIRNPGPESRFRFTACQYELNAARKSSRNLMNDRYE